MKLELCFETEADNAAKVGPVEIEGGDSEGGEREEGGEVVGEEANRRKVVAGGLTECVCRKWRTVRRLAEK